MCSGRNDRFKAPLRLGLSLGEAGVKILRVKVRYFTTLRELAGTAEDEIEIEDAAPLSRLVEEIASGYGKEARSYLYHEEEIDPSIYFLVNGKSARMLSGKETKLKNGDIVAIIPPIGGGQHTAISGSLLC